MAEALWICSVLQATCCHLRPHQLVNSSQGEHADVRVVSKLRSLSKRLLCLLSTCENVNSVQCATVILAILRSCAQHHPMMSACEECTQTLPGNVEFEESCCTGCSVVISCSRLLLSPHRLLVQAAQGVIKASAHAKEQALAVLHIARKLLLHSVMQWPKNQPCMPKHTVSSSPQVQGRILFFLRYVEAVLSTDSGPAAAIQTGASQAALRLAAQLHSTQSGCIQRKSIIWKVSERFEWSKTSCFGHQPLVLYSGVPAQASQAMISAASNTIIAAAACVDLWHICATSISNHYGKHSAWQSISNNADSQEPGEPPPRKTHQFSFAWDYFSISAPEKEQPPQPPRKVHAAGDGDGCFNSVNRCYKPLRSSAESRSAVDLNQTPSTLSSFSSNVSVCLDEEIELHSVALNSSLPVLLHGLVATTAAPSSSSLVLRAVSKFLPRVHGVHTSAERSAMHCAATALHQIRDSLMTRELGATSHSKKRCERFTLRPVGQRPDAAAPQAVAEFLQALVAWVQSQKQDQSCQKHLTQLVRSFGEWLCSLLEHVGSPAVHQALSKNSSSHFSAANGAGDTHTSPVRIISSETQGTGHSFGYTACTEFPAVRSTALSYVSITTEGLLDLHCTVSSASVAAAHMQMCIAVLNQLVSGGADVLHVLASRTLARVIRQAADRALSLTLSLMTQSPQVSNGTLDNCVTMLRHLMASIRAVGRFERDRESHTQLQVKTGGVVSAGTDECNGSSGECDARSENPIEVAAQKRRVGSGQALMHVDGEEWLQVHLEVMRKLLSMELMHHLPITATLLCEVHRALEDFDAEGSPCKNLVQDQLGLRVDVLQRLCDMQAQHLQHACDSITHEPEAGCTETQPAEEFGRDSTFQCSGETLTPQQRLPGAEVGKEQAMQDCCTRNYDCIFVDTSGDLCLCDSGSDMKSKQGVIWSFKELLSAALSSGRGGLVLLHAAKVSRLCTSRISSTSA